MKQRNILMVTMGLDIGGAETHIVELAKALQAQGHQVTVMSNGGVYEAELTAAGVNCLWAPLHRRTPATLLKSLVLLRKYIGALAPDVVHAHARIPAFLCGLLHKRMGFPFVTTAHWVFHAGGLAGLLTNWGQRSLAVSEDIKSYLQTAYHIPNEHITVTINGIDTEKFSPEISGAGIREEMGIPKDALCIASVSRLDDSRALAARQLIAVAPRLIEVYPNLHLLIAGGGDVYDQLKAQADAVNDRLGRTAVHLPGARTDINAIVAAGDVFVGVSRAALEAMAAGKPVVVAGNEGYHGIFTADKLAEAMLGNFCCRGLPQSTEEALLADLMCLLQTDAAALREQGAYNRSVVQSHYSVERMAADALAVYSAVWTE